MVAMATSLLMSHELSFLKNHKQTHNFKQLDVLSFRFMDGEHRPSCSVPSRNNVFVCQTSMVPIRASEISILKTASAVLSRSYNAFHGYPFVLQLASGLIIIVFAIWGLAPLTRFGRSLFLKQSDSSWKRSGAHYVTTSYLRPLLLWTGATLVCRALDPMVLSSEASQLVKKRLLVFVRSLSTVLAFAYCLSSLIHQTQQLLVESSDSNDSTNTGVQFAGKAIYSAVWVAAVSLFMELLGFSTQKMLTAGGLGTVLLTLSGREIFTNFLSSLMIHATRPFVLNEWIQTKIEGYEVSGTVEHVGWWSPTIIRGDDREAVHIPNHKFTVNVVRNLSQKTHWRIKTYFFISHLDVNKINLIVADMRKVLAKNPQVEQQRLHRRVFLERIDPENQALVIMVSCFVKTSRFEEYSCVKEAVLLDLLRVISHHGARLATPIRTMHKTHSDEDMENIPFSETVFTRARAAMHRSLFLIEPSYKINSEDKIKTQTSSTRANEDQDASTIARDSTTAVPDLKEAFSSEADKEIMTKSQSEFDDTTAATSSSSQSDSKLDSKSSQLRSGLEDNIVLGVALDGSKMTLPIEEGVSSNPPPAEKKKLAPRGNGNGSSSAAEDKQENHTLAS